MAKKKKKSRKESAFSNFINEPSPSDVPRPSDEPKPPSGEPEPSDEAMPGNNGNEVKPVVSNDVADIHEGMKDLCLNIKSFFQSSRFSDFVIQTSDQVFKVHKLLLCGQSEFFSLMFNGDYKETVENTITLKEDDPRAIEAMVHFMYGYDYDSSGSDHGRVSPLLFNIKVYQVADKYGVRALKQRAKQKFEETIEACWAMDDLPHAILDVYERTEKDDRNLKDIVLKVIRAHINILIEDSNFKQVLESNNGFAVDLARDLVKMQKDLINFNLKYGCPNCQRCWCVENDNEPSRCPFCDAVRGSWDSWRKS